MKYFCVDRQSVLSDGLFATKKQSLPMQALFCVSTRCQKTHLYSKWNREFSDSAGAEINRGNIVLPLRDDPGAKCFVVYFFSWLIG